MKVAVWFGFGVGVIVGFWVGVGWLPWFVGVVVGVVVGVGWFVRSGLVSVAAE